jgi:membrane protein implicated in regulation of membrane protease activity
MKTKTIIILLIIADLTLTFFTGRGIVGLFHAMGATFITISDVIDAYVVPFLIYTVLGFVALYQYLRREEKKEQNARFANK